MVSVTLIVSLLQQFCVERKEITNNCYQPKWYVVIV